MDLQEMLAQFDDKELLAEVAELFLKIYPQQLQGIRAAIDSNDARSLERTAHSLKGAAANFGAKEVAARALRLEHMGHEGALQGAQSAAQELEEGLEQLAAVLAEIGVRARD
jgi:HPt (histidine-containing phosphotransfer) domain-containing protein